MVKKTGFLFILFAVLCVSVIAAGMFAIRYTQGTANDGDWLLALIFVLVAIADLLIVRSLY